MHDGYVFHNGYVLHDGYAYKHGYMVLDGWILHHDKTLGNQIIWFVQIKFQDLWRCLLNMSDKLY